MAGWSFINKITEQIRKPRLGEEKAPTLWPSEASAIIENQYGEEVNIGKCRRSIFFRYLISSYKYYEKYAPYSALVEEIKTKEVPPDKYTYFIWAQGNLYEDYLLENSKMAGVYVADQTQVYIPSHNVSGKIDIVVQDEDGLYRIVEAKSIYGFNATKILGTPSERKSGIMGVPKPSYLMQLGLYQWWYANGKENFGDALLVCGARDTGKYGEFGITVEPNEQTSEDHIYYYQNDPYPGDKVDSKISIQNILRQYEYVQQCLDSGIIPDRDFDLFYSDEKIDTLYERNELTKSEIQRYEKRKEQLEQNKTKINKQIEKGDWQCSYCSYKDVCYNKQSEPREIKLRG